MKEFNKVYAVSVDAGEYLLLQETMFEQSIQLTSVVVNKIWPQF